MFKKKSRTELYEILKENKSASSSGGQKKEEITSYPVKPMAREAKQEAVIAQPMPVKKPPYPKFKMPSPTNAPAADKKLPLPIIKLALLLIVVAAALVGIYFAVGYLIKNKPFSRSTEPANAVAPIAPVNIWSLRMIYYDDNADGLEKATKAYTFLKDNGAKDVFTKKEFLDNAFRISVYTGKYATKEEAMKDRPKLKQLHPAFKSVDAILLEGK